MNLHIGVVILRNDGLLLRKITHALENEVGAAARNLHVQLLPQRIHIPTNLLEVEGRHMNDAGEVETRNLDVLHIRVKELQEIVRHRRLLRVLHPDSQLVRIGRRQIQCQIIIIPHRLNQLEKIDHVHAQHMLCRTVVRLEAIRV